MAYLRRLNECLAQFTPMLDGIGSSVVVAGGAVRDALRYDSDPKDFDLFVMNADVSKESLGAVAELIVPHFGAVKNLHFHKSEPFLAASVEWNNSVVQIMLTDAKTVEELVDRFDWHVSRFAYDGGAVYAPEDVQTIGPGLPLLLRRVTYPLSTLRRGFRFSERFGMELKYEDVLDLSRQILARNIE